MRFKVFLTAECIVEAENKEEAEERAYDLLEEELGSPYQSIYDIFKIRIEPEE